MREDNLFLVLQPRPNSCQRPGIWDLLQCCGSKIPRQCLDDGVQPRVLLLNVLDHLFVSQLRLPLLDVSGKASWRNGTLTSKSRNTVPHFLLHLPCNTVFFELLQPNVAIEELIQPPDEHFVRNPCHRVQMVGRPRNQQFRVLMSRLSKKNLEKAAPNKIRRARDVPGKS